MGTCMILDERVEPLQRSWCLFETFQSLILKSEDAQFQGLMFCTAQGVLNRRAKAFDVAMNIAASLSTLKVEDASATVEEDKIMIDGLIAAHPGSFPHVNNFVRGSIREALHQTRALFEGDFKVLDQML